MKKILFSIFCCCILSFSAFTQVINGIGYIIRETTATVLSMNPKYSGNIIIPSTVVYEGKNYTVTRIGDGAFKNCTGLTSITLPNTITSIGNNAFRGCTRITSITLPNSITSIENSAFRECTGLISITLPNNLTSIGKYAFWDCEKLTPVDIPISVTYVGTSAFPLYVDKEKILSSRETSEAIEKQTVTSDMEEFKRCPYCGEEILAVAIKCKHCGEWLDKPATSKTSKKQSTAKKSQSVVRGVNSIPNRPGEVSLGFSPITSIGNYLINFGFCGKLRVGVAKPIRLEGSFTYYLPKIVKLGGFEIKYNIWEVNLNMQTIIAKWEKFIPYPLIGLGISGVKVSVSDDSGGKTFFGFNVGAGFDVKLYKKLFFNVEGKSLIVFKKTNLKYGSELGSRGMISAGLIVKF